MKGKIKNMNASTLVSRLCTWKAINYAMPEHEYASCSVCYDINYYSYISGYTMVIYLKSYNTVVCGLVKDTTSDEVKYYRFITGLYSRTTIKHIGWFTKYIDKEASYFTYKEMLNNDGIEEITEDIFDKAYRHFH